MKKPKYLTVQKCVEIRKAKWWNPFDVGDRKWVKIGKIRIYDCKKEKEKRP